MSSATNNYSRAFSSLGCAELELDEVLKIASRYEIEAVELRALADSIDLVAYFEEKFKTPEALADHIAKSGIKVVALDASCKVISDDTSDRAELSALAPWAHALGGAWIRVFDGGEKLDAPELARASEMLTWWQQERAEHEWACDLMIETHDSMITSSQINRVLEAASSGTWVLWDALHTWNLGGESPAETWNAIHESVAHIHVKDAVPGKEMQGTRHTLPGSGEYPMAELRDVLRGSDYRGALSLEWARKWHTYLPTIETALIAAKTNRWW
jgi:sugar phosphate isomerase/epimerase